jgi:hypothetical protein
VSNTESPQLSGKVFRFLSAMHPALSKAERKRYAGFDPDQWYPWTQEVSTEFTDLMRRSPRDTSFARGFAYVAQRAVPEGSYIPTTALLQNLAKLPAAFRGPEGTGFLAAVDSPGHATVRYQGMPGFANVCIAIQGELTQRLQASGAQSVVVKHGANCRVNGAETCDFEIEWTGEAPPPDTSPVNLRELVGEEAVDEAAAAATPVAAGGAPAQQAAVAQQAQTSETVEPTPKKQPKKAAQTAQPVQPDTGAAMVAATELAEGQAAGSGDELFQQLRKRLAEADRQARMFAEAQEEIDKLRVELSRMKAQAEAEVAQAQKERTEAVDSVADLKRRIQEIVGSD